MMKNRSEVLIRSRSMKKVTIKAVAHATAFFIPAIVLSLFSFSASAEKGVSMEQRIRHLEELSQTRNKVQADLTYQLSELQREIRSLTGQVEENDFKLKQIQERQRDLYRDIEQRLSGIKLGGAASTSMTQGTTRATGQAKQPVPIDATGEVRREFESAFKQVRNKNYAAAIKSFNIFLSKYPNNSYSANAHYWLGQVYLVQNNSSDAAKQFLALISQFPDSSKRDASKLKLADIYSKRKKWSEAKALYTEVEKNSSGTQQQLARKGLEKIKQAGH